MAFVGNTSSLFAMARDQWSGLCWLCCLKLWAESCEDIDIRIKTTVTKWFCIWRRVLLPCQTGFFLSSCYIQAEVERKLAVFCASHFAIMITCLCHMRLWQKTFCHTWLWSHVLTQKSCKLTSVTNHLLKRPVSVASLGVSPYKTSPEGHQKLQHCQEGASDQFHIQFRWIISWPGGELSQDYSWKSMWKRFLQSAKNFYASTSFENFCKPRRWQRQSEPRSGEHWWRFELWKAARKKQLSTWLATLKLEIPIFTHAENNL